MVENNGTIIRQITNINPDSDSVNIFPASDNYINFINYILYHDRFPQIMMDNWGDSSGNIPNFITLDFNVYLNKVSTWIYFKGNLQFIDLEGVTYE